MDPAPDEPDEPDEPDDESDDESGEPDDEQPARPFPWPRVTPVIVSALLAGAMGAMLGGAALGAANAQTRARLDNERAHAEREAAAAQPPEQENDPSDEADADAVSGTLVGTTLGTGRTLGQVLTALRVEPRTASQVGQALGALVPLRTLRPTDQVAVERADGEAGEAVLRVFLVRGVVSWEVLQDEQGAWHAQARTEAMPEVQWQGRVVAGGDRAGSQRPAALNTIPHEGDASFRVTHAGPVTGYVHGRAMALRVTIVENIPVEEHTAAQYGRMHDAAARDGVQLHLVSGFRTMEHQRYLYALYRAGRGNLAAIPGTSNHQSGHALDLNTRAPGVYGWLNRNGGRYGFRRTVPTEAWHWECW